MYLVSDRETFEYNDELKDFFIGLDESKIDVTPDPIDQTVTSSESQEDVSTYIPDVNTDNGGSTDQTQGYNTDTSTEPDPGLPIVDDF